MPYYVKSLECAKNSSKFRCVLEFGTDGKVWDCWRDEVGWWAVMCRGGVMWNLRCINHINCVRL